LIKSIEDGPKSLEEKETTEWLFDAIKRGRFLVQFCHLMIIIIK